MTAILDEHRIEQKISSIVEHQFPAFFREEGPVFVLFVKAYYEWLEQSGNVLDRSRNALTYFDIDDTLDEFLAHFQEKYLYGIPFDVIINKRFLLKHILDVYRSKSSIQGYELLFKLIYNEDVHVYLPGRDMLRLSAGTWTVPKYVEINTTNAATSFVNQPIVGLSSNVRAVVESYNIEQWNENEIGVLYISNIIPNNGQFEVGERLIKQTDYDSGNTANVITTLPTVRGSLNYIEIVNGGRDFAIGDILKIKQRDGNTRLAFGRDGLVRTSNLTIGRGTIAFTIDDGGFGYTGKSDLDRTFTYNGATDTTGSGASFQTRSITSGSVVTFNTDLIADYQDTTIDAANYEFPLDIGANASYAIEDALSFDTKTLGTIASLYLIETGANYTEPTTNFVRFVTPSKNAMTGSLTYNTASKSITGTSTVFENYLANNDTIILRPDNSVGNTNDEYMIIKEVVSNTVLTMYGYPTNNSTANSVYLLAPTMLPSNFATYDSIMFQANNSIAGENESILGLPSFGNNVIANTTIVESGIGYIQDELITMYLYGGVTDPTIVSGGTGYVNGDILVFTAISGKAANGSVLTNGNGVITNTSMTYYGSGYEVAPDIIVKSTTGSGANLTTTLTEFNPNYEVTGYVKKRGIGQRRGYWKTTDGFLNSDKYIQDSYYYQDFSYEFQVKIALEKYKNILYDTFHVSGTEMFGKQAFVETIQSTIQLQSEPAAANTSLVITDLTQYKADTDILTADDEQISLDMDLLYTI